MPPVTRYFMSASMQEGDARRGKSTAAAAVLSRRRPWRSVEVRARSLRLRSISDLGASDGRLSWRQQMFRSDTGLDDVRFRRGIDGTTLSHL
jgi:hypothetical protein